MSNAGSTRGHGDSHRRRDHRRSTKNEAQADATLSVFQSPHTPMVGSSRRHRGYQPDEVTKKVQKLELGTALIVKDKANATKPIVIETHPKASAIDHKLASTMNANSSKPLPPHLQTHAQGTKSSHPPFTHTQVATMDASRPELDLVHFDGVSEPIDSEVSSTQIITERKPSFWSRISPPEKPPTEWNSSAANIDRPATRKLPIYRFSKPGHKAERDNTSNSFNQQAKTKSQAGGSRLKAQKSHGTNDSAELAIETNDGIEATARVASQEDRLAIDSLHHQFQELQRDERLDAEQASQIKAIEDEVLSGNIDGLPEGQLEVDQLRVSSPARDTAEAQLVNSNASSSVPSQKNQQLYTPPGKRSGVAPHLRVPAARQAQNNKHESLLGTSPSLSITAASKMTARNEDLESERHTASGIEGSRLPPHLRIPPTVKHQSNKDSVSNTISLPAPLKDEDSYKPEIDMDEEIAAAQPVLDIDEEIVAGLREETSSAFLGAQPTDSNAGGTREETACVSSHAESKSKVKEQTKSQVDQRGNRNHGTNTSPNGLTANSHTASPLNIDTTPDDAKSSIRKGNNPAKELVSAGYTSELVGWDGKMNQPPVGDEWDRRQPFIPQSDERLSLIEAWRKEHAADPEESNRLSVDTASADFQTGEGPIGGDTNVLSPIDRKDHETLASKDDFTQARRHQSAADSIKDYAAKMAAKPKSIPSGIEGMTKEEKRRFRRALIEEERARRTLPNPHAPAANIYLRPAEFKDMGQITTIYNYNVRETSFVLHLDNVDELYWRSRLQEAENEKNPFIVAIHMGERSCRRHEDIIRKKQENVVGFAVAADLGSKATVYHNTVELELMIHPDFYNQGTGRTLLDRILAALSPDHNLLECAPFLPQNDISHWIRGGSRQAKAVLVNIHYCDGEEDVITWRKQWLAKYDFQHVGTLPHIGFKKGKLVNTCQLVLNTSARL